MSRIAFDCAKCFLSLQLEERIYKKEYEGHTLCMSCRPAEKVDQILTEEELKEVIGFVEYDVEEGNNIFWGHAKLLLEEINRLKKLELSYLSANAELSFKNMKLKEKDAKVTEFMDWAKRIIDSGMGAGILKYDPVQFFIEYHTYLKSLEELK